MAVLALVTEAPTAESWSLQEHAGTQQEAFLQGKARWKVSSLRKLFIFSFSKGSFWPLHIYCSLVVFALEMGIEMHGNYCRTKK